MPSIIFFHEFVQPQNQPLSSQDNSAPQVSQRTWQRWIKFISLLQTGHKTAFWADIRGKAFAFA
jgi:hypothetical protein